MLKNNKLTLIPAAYKDSKVYSQIPLNGDGDFTFTRSSYATRINSDGFIEVMGANTPRLDYSNGKCPALLLEKASTNLVKYSEDLSVSNWIKTSVTVESNSELAPDGTMSADKLQRTSTSANYIQNNFTKSTSLAVDSTASIFVKKGNSNYVAVRFQGVHPNRYEINYNFTTGGLAKRAMGSFVGIEAGFEDYGNGWIRLYLSATTDASSAAGIFVSPKSDNQWLDEVDPSNDSYCYLWGAQVEESIKSTSYIPTDSSTYTRTTEFCLDAMSNNTVLKSNDWTLFFDVDCSGVLSDFNRISLNDGSTANKVLLNYNGSSNKFSFTTANSGVVINYQEIITTGRQKIAMVSTWQGYDLYANGVFISSQTEGEFDASSITSVDFSQASTSLPFEGRVYGLRYYNTDLTEQELITLTK